MGEHELKSFLQNCVYNIISALEDIENNDEHLTELRHESFMHISNSKSAGELKQIIDNLLKRYYDIISEGVGYSDAKTINKILDYINVHYNEALTLKILAETFNFNYYYLSSYFVSHCKEGFSEYLNKVRINKACELLRKDVMPISEICGAVGYTDHS